VEAIQLVGGRADRTVHLDGRITSPTMITVGTTRTDDATLCQQLGSTRIP
jgi:hypothetical protein